MAKHKAQRIGPRGVAINVAPRVQFLGTDFETLTRRLKFGRRRRASGGGGRRSIDEFPPVPALACDDAAITFEETFVASGSFKWCGGATATDGCTYCFGTSQDDMLKYDPTDESFSLIPMLGVPSASFKSSGAVVAPNGTLYSVPFFQTYVIKFNPSTGVFSTITRPTAGWSHAAGTVGPDGHIYYPPHQGNVWLELDPDSDTFFTHVNALPGMGPLAYGGAVTGDDGFIYATPRSADHFARFDPVTKVATVVGAGTFPASTSGYLGAAYAGDGKIYAIPFISGTVVELDITDDSVTTVATPLSGSYIGGVVGINGRVYGLPWTANTMLEITPQGDDPPLVIQIPHGLPTGGKSWFGAATSDGKVLMVGTSTDPALMSLGCINIPPFDPFDLKVNYA